MTCQQLAQLVTDYVEGKLPWRRRLAFRMHLLMCRHCREYVRELRLTVERLGRLPSEPMPPNVRDELMRRFETW